LAIYLFCRKETDLAMKEYRSAAASSDGLMAMEGGKRRMVNVRYRHTTETLTVGRLGTSKYARVTLLTKVFRVCTDVIYEDRR